MNLFKAMVLTSLLLIGTAVMVGCTSEKELVEEASRDKNRASSAAKKAVDAILYKQHRDGRCYAVATSKTKDGYLVISIALVDSGACK